MDQTENIRRALVSENNTAVQSDSKEAERLRLEAIHGKGNVWDTGELSQQFAVQSFAAPFCFVKRKSDGQPGIVEFQHSPRLYFGFMIEN
jgi:hypothetical protein